MLDVSAVFYVETADFLTLGSCLMGLELHTQNVTRQGLDVVNGLGHFNAAAFAAPASVNLGFYNPNWAAQFLCGFNSLLHGKSDNAPWCGHAELSQDFLALILMNLHVRTLKV